MIKDAMRLQERWSVQNEYLMGLEAYLKELPLCYIDERIKINEERVKAIHAICECEREMKLFMGGIK